MGRVNAPKLDEKSKTELEIGIKNGKTHALRKRCQLILLKSENRTSEEVGKILKMCAMSVNNWVERYQAEGISGLRTKRGRGRKPILDKTADAPMVLSIVKTHRQRIMVAKVEIESRSGKVLSRDTLRRFLKVLADGSSV